MTTGMSNIDEGLRRNIDSILIGKMFYPTWNVYGISVLSLIFQLYTVLGSFFEDLHFKGLFLSTNLWNISNNLFHLSSSFGNLIV